MYSKIKLKKAALRKKYEENFKKKEGIEAFVMYKKKKKERAEMLKERKALIEEYCFERDRIYEELDKNGFNMFNILFSRKYFRDKAKLRRQLKAYKLKMKKKELERKKKIRWRFINVKFRSERDIIQNLSIIKKTELNNKMLCIKKNKIQNLKRSVFFRVLEKNNISEADYKLYVKKHIDSPLINLSTHIFLDRVKVLAFIKFYDRVKQRRDPYSVLSDNRKGYPTFEVNEGELLGYSF